MQHEMPSETYRKLEDFIRNRMRMSHIYQPVMLRVLLSHNGRASVAEIAKELLAHDQSQVEYYEQVTKNMVGAVLTARNEITEAVRDGRRITGYSIPHFEELSKSEIDALLALCDGKTTEYIDRRGDRIWSHRHSSVGYISGTMQYEVLKRAKFRCELCGTLDDDKALQVDHIVPRNHGGSDDPENLQALCYSCNASKRDRDATDFRGIPETYNHREPGCVFCEIDSSRVVNSNALAFVVRDKHPVSDLHSLIIPKRHVSSYFDLYQPELNAITALLHAAKKQIEDTDPTVSAFNIGVNAGTAAGQTVHHCHVHLIPRRPGDTEDPRGGVRGVIPEKQSY